MKIYNEIIIAWNDETQQYDTVVYEDAFSHDGNVAMMQRSDQDGLWTVADQTYQNPITAEQFCNDFYQNDLGIGTNCGGAYDFVLSNLPMFTPQIQDALNSNNNFFTSLTNQAVNGLYYFDVDNPNRGYYNYQTINSNNVYAIANQQTLVC